MNNSTGSPFRFGILCDKAGLTGWQAMTIRRLIESGAAQPELLIVDASVHSPRETKGGVLWQLFAWCDRVRRTKLVGLTNDVVAIPWLECQTLHDGSAESFTDRDVRSIRSYDLDFILKFGFGDLRGGILQSARHGVWSFRFSDGRSQNAPPYFWEICDGDAVSAAALLRLSDNGQGHAVLRQGFLRTVDYSYSRTYDRVLAECATWPAYVAAQIRRGVAPATESAAPAHAPVPPRGRPSELATARFLGIVGRNMVRHILERFVREEWSIGIVPLSVDEIVRGAVINDVNWFPNPKDGWVADPMALPRNEQVDVLCERMDLGTEQGYIAAASFNGRGWSEATPVIRTECHASYPYLLEEHGQIFCIPETGDANEVAIYRAVEFPHVWAKAGTLLRRVAAIDSTIFRYADRWWLFATSREASNHKLFAWFAQNIRGPWHPHEANPIKIDVRSSRPAGPPVWVDGSLYRPAQDSSRTYGGRIALNRIVELTPTRFREELVSYVEPNAQSPYGRALHHISPAGKHCVIDGMRWRSKRIGTKGVA